MASQNELNPLTRAEAPLVLVFMRWKRRNEKQGVAQH
jgi:hypothetical protein